MKLLQCNWGFIDWPILELFELDRTLEPFHVNHFNSIWPNELVNISILHTSMCIRYHNKFKHKIIFNICHLQSTFIHDHCHDPSFMIFLICNVAWSNFKCCSFGDIFVELWRLQQ
jgi:hypothetical protein